MKVSGNYSDLWKAIIRPPRDPYTLESLGKRKYVRKDIDLMNPDAWTLRCSHFLPHNYESIKTKLPCVIYMHGNCSSRLEALPCVNILLPLNITVFAFDFSGCGQSQGEFVTLGWKEKEDLQTVINYLRSTDMVSLIGLWGRSMGAVTSILQAARDPSIAGMVLDSPFSNLNKLSLELAKTHTKIPALIAKIVQKLIRKSIMSRTKLDIEKLNPIEYVDKCFIPSLFVTAKGDDFVRPHHGEQLFDKYSGDKNMISVEGDHNSDRPFFMMDSVAIFFHNVLQCDQLPRELDDDEENLMNNDDFMDFRLDKVFERQHQEQEREQLLLSVQDKLDLNQQEDEDYRRALLESLDYHQEEKMKEKVVDQFFYQLEHCWQEKENLPEILDAELRHLDQYFKDEEKESIKSLALQRRNSLKAFPMNRQSSQKEVFGEVDLNQQLQSLEI
ncbi:UNKNOWN [Stylonychia lemnae]|uniref:Serine aminopeptidase S33 domain-containing protein n=1 Tax=Stylonychia lemnae TaxID=5949 RepID=A0A078ASJ1_STYLE|nr:UNKNOWN [Stylonychia lemnae]|eukprot:CDW85425.1 UNKNOWN [Stylonychia lemnae]